MKYQWEQLPDMYGQLGFAAKQLRDRHTTSDVEGNHVIAVVQEGSEARPREVTPLLVPEPV